MRFISFTDKGQRLAAQLARELDGSYCRCGEGVTLDGWTREGFERGEDLVFVGAVGIAVRAVAPYVVHKAQDPAVVVVDECALHAISLLSGHLGGANELTRRVARACGAEPVITTATDCNGVFAIDSWAASQGCAVANPARIKSVSAKLLAGDEVLVACELPVDGVAPDGVVAVSPGELAGRKPDVVVGWHTYVAQDALHVVPRIATLGMGCRRGVPFEVIEERFAGFCAAGDVSPLAIRQVCSIDLKASEYGLLRFCEAHGWSLETFSAEQLALVEGSFTASSFVAKTVGVDNVCERAAVLGSKGALACKKDAGDGVTFALAVSPCRLSWPGHEERRNDD